jgi:hypothetical protein
MKKILLITVLIISLISLARYAFAAGALDTETIPASVQVNAFTGLTLYEADDKTEITNGSERKFSKNHTSTDEYKPNPGETSWADSPTPDNWTVEGPPNSDGIYPNAPSRIMARCVYNTNSSSGIWYLKIKATQLTSGINTIPYSFTSISTGKTYAYYGWTEYHSAEETGSSPNNGHYYDYGNQQDQRMMEYKSNDEIAYKSGAGETGAKISIWTGIQIPFDQAAATTTPYTSIITFTMAN